MRRQIRKPMSARAKELAVQKLDKLRGERREIITRVEKMLRLLDDASALSGQEDLLAAVDEDD